jgi:hypothetical protein
VLKKVISAFSNGSNNTYTTLSHMYWLRTYCCIHRFLCPHGGFLTTLLPSRCSPSLIVLPTERRTCVRVISFVLFAGIAGAGLPQMLVSQVRGRVCAYVRRHLCGRRSGRRCSPPPHAHFWLPAGIARAGLMTLATVAKMCLATACACGLGAPAGLSLPPACGARDRRIAPVRRWAMRACRQGRE